MYHLLLFFSVLFCFLIVFYISNLVFSLFTLFDLRLYGGGVSSLSILIFFWYIICIISFILRLFWCFSPQFLHLCLCHFHSQYYLPRLFLLFISWNSLFFVLIRHTIVICWYTFVLKIRSEIYFKILPIGNADYNNQFTVFQ